MPKDKYVEIAIYNTFIFLYQTAIRIAALFNEKARLWVNGRKDIFTKLSNALSGNTHPILWVHCASLGEFEQGRPLIERFKREFPDYKILLTFFSPSGYEIRKNYNQADWVFYLPADTKSNARTFVQLVQPKLAVFVKYEYWYHYLNELHNTHTPAILISAIFRENAIFFKWYGALHRKMLQLFSHLFVQTYDSVERAKQFVSSEKITLAGDTRFDRVYEIAGSFEPIPAIADFIKDRKVIVAGSTWPEDEIQLKKLMDQLEDEMLLIIAPHEITETHLQFVNNTFPGCVFYSQLKQNPQLNGSVLIIDNIGMLSKLYHYSTISYIGGGFNKSGIHNTLEAAVYGKPVVFGPNYQKFAEAVGLINCGGGFSYQNDNELIKVVQSLLGNEQKLQSVGTAADQFVKNNTGATEKIITWVRRTFS